MTVNSIYQSFSVASVSFSLNSRPASSATSSPSVTSPRVDRVTLSPGATAGVAPAGTDQAEPTPAAPAPAEPRPASRAERRGEQRAERAEQRAERRAEALFDALDADEDGAITEQEFTEGAVALLRRAGERRRVREHDGDGHGDGDHAARGLRRLERKLEQAFGRVDANDDGAIDKDELTSALAQAGRRGRGAEPTPPTEPPPPAELPSPAEPTAPQDPSASAGTSVTFSFTFVSVAVQRYTALQPPAQATSSTTTAADQKRAA